MEGLSKSEFLNEQLP